ncbi:OsmC family protein [uncultured Paraglaciecola sp.]|uniref:OsmC family protein n=1 Tax=uncultured Paraglaciecola sp. TaxID=1765024 RepID=UPI0030DBBB01|tara:strand:+ start:4130 stop:4522 length:393 start_codon:yes stop_codon:yes gene_type:complete
MKATVSWQENLRFTCKTDTGHTLDLDGNGESMSPMESVLLSVGACSSIDVVDILKKTRKQVDDCVCQLEAKRAEQAPRFFTAIHAHYIVKGDGLLDKNVARAVQLSTEKYCSVMLMLAGNVEITTSYELV